MGRAKKEMKAEEIKIQKIEARVSLQPYYSTAKEICDLQSKNKELIEENEKSDRAWKKTLWMSSQDIARLEEKNKELIECIKRIKDANMIDDPEKSFNIINNEIIEALKTNKK